MSDYKINKTDAEWKSQLSDEQYRILRKKGTEMPFTGIYNNHSETGLYYCAGCEAPLFKSEAKFDSGCGWPSFDAAIEGQVKYALDKTHGMLRTEILCQSCGGHLGHVFNDGPTSSGNRYCVNSVSLDFKKS